MAAPSDNDSRGLAALTRLVAERTRKPFAPDAEAMQTREALKAAGGDESVLAAWRAAIAPSVELRRIAVWGGADPAAAADLARRRFGFHATLETAATPEAALTAAKTSASVAVLALDDHTPWWGRLLAEPRLNVCAILPETPHPAPVSALAVAAVPVEPTGVDETLWVTDARAADAALEAALGQAGFAARWIASAGGLKLFGLAGYVQRQDPRLLAVPGRLNGVIGAAASPFEA